MIQLVDRLLTPGDVVSLSPSVEVIAWVDGSSMLKVAGRLSQSSK